MNFLSLVIALILRQFPGASESVQRDEWFRQWRARVAGWGLGAGGRLAVAVLLPLVAAQLLLDLLQPLLFGLLWIALAVILLLYGLGRGDFRQRMARYRSHCQVGDFEGAYLDTLPTPDPALAPQSPQDVHDAIQREFFYEGFQRWFPVLFYFVVFGPVGALAYRLLQFCRNGSESALAERCLFVADWVPARLLAATFTLTGNFVGSRDALFNSLGDMGLAPARLLHVVGTAALESTLSQTGNDQSFSADAVAQNENTERLLLRSAVCWVGIIALVVLLG